MYKFLPINLFGFDSGESVSLAPPFVRCRLILMESLRLGDGNLGDNCPELDREFEERLSAVEAESLSELAECFSAVLSELAECVSTALSEFVECFSGELLDSAECLSSVLSRLVECLSSVLSVFSECFSAVISELDACLSVVFLSKFSAGSFSLFDKFSPSTESLLLVSEVPWSKSGECLFSESCSEDLTCSVLFSVISLSSPLVGISSSSLGPTPIS